MLQSFRFLRCFYLLPYAFAGFNFYYFNSMFFCPYLYKINWFHLSDYLSFYDSYSFSLVILSTFLIPSYMYSGRNLKNYLYYFFSILFFKKQILFDIILLFIVIIFGYFLFKNGVVLADTVPNNINSSSKAIADVLIVKKPPLVFYVQVTSDVYNILLQHPGMVKLLHMEPNKYIIELNIDPVVMNQLISHGHIIKEVVLSPDTVSRIESFSMVTLLAMGLAKLHAFFTPITDFISSTF